jgi:predicted Co/Zn/Cd cation transporter (cation efflux family)
MSFGELLPTLSGLSLGIFLALSRTSWQKHTRVFAVLLLGFFSCFVNGELGTSWAFVLVDALLVALAAIAGIALGTRLRWLRRIGRSIAAPNELREGTRYASARDELAS